MNAYGTNHIEAEKVLKRMKIDKVTPDVTTYNTLMNAYGTNHIEAEKVLKRMKIDKVNTRRYNVQHSDERVRYEPYRKRRRC